MKCRCHSCRKKGRKFCDHGTNAGKPGPCPTGQASQARPDSTERKAHPVGALPSQMRPDSTSEVGHVRPVSKEETSARERLTEAIKTQKADLTGSRKLKDAVAALRKEVHGHLAARLAGLIEVARKMPPYADVREAWRHFGALKPGEYVTDGSGNVGAVVQVPIYSHMGQHKKTGHENGVRWVGTGQTDTPSAIRHERMLTIRPLGVSTQSLAAANKFSESGSVLRGVEVFASGTHRGQKYSRRDINDMAANFRTHSDPSKGKPRVRVPAVLGHEETQEYLERSDLPAAAWARRAWAENGRDADGKPCRVLKVDFEDVPPKVARLLKGKRYRTVSAEVYDEPPEGVPGKGKMLRRVAFLGGDIPQVKSLEDIPTPVDSHSESGSHYTPVVLRFRESQRVTCANGACFVRCFSEVTPMDREALLKRLAELGYDVGLLTESVPDPVLAEMVRVTEDALDQSEPDGDEEVADEVPDEQLAEEDEEDKDKEPPKGTEPPHSDHGDDEEPMPPEDREDEKAMAEYGRAMAEYADNCRAHKEGATVTKTAAQFTELKGQQAKLKGQLDALQKFAEGRMAAEKRATVTAELDALVASGKVLPAERDGGLDDTLYSLTTDKILKFSEKGKTVERSPFDQMLLALKNRPVLVRFGERVKAGQPVKGEDDADKAKITQHFERFSEDFGRHGMTKEKLVAGFEAERKRRPKLTADEYLAV